MLNDERASLASFFCGSVTLGERGQVVIPAEARKEFGLKPGDKLLVFRHPHVRGVVLTRVEDMRALMEELQQWDVTMAKLIENTEEESEHE